MIISMVIYSKGLNAGEDQRTVSYEFQIGTEHILEKKTHSFLAALARVDNEKDPGRKTILYEVAKPTLRDIAESLCLEGIILEPNDKIIPLLATGYISGTVYAPLTTEQIIEFIKNYNYVRTQQK